MRKSIYLLLITIILLQADGMLLLFKIQQWHSQQQMIQVIKNPESVLQKIILTHEEYRIAKINKRELRIKNKLYDIKSIRISGNQVELMAINDSKEEQILKRINILLKHNNQPNTKIPKYLKTFLSLQYLIPFAKYTFCIFIESFLGFPKVNDEMIFTYFDISTPPPKLA